MVVDIFYVGNVKNTASELQEGTHKCQATGDLVR